MNDTITSVAEVRNNSKYNVTFAKYLDIRPDIYANVVLTKDIIPARVITELNRNDCITLYELLDYKLTDFICLRNIGIIALNETIQAIRKYCSIHKQVSYCTDKNFPRVADILPNGYDDFIEYCKEIGKLSPHDLSTPDYENFRSQNHLQHEYISDIRQQLADFCIINTNICNRLCSAYCLTELYRNSGYTLTQIFGVFPEMYNKVKVEDVGDNILYIRSFSQSYMIMGCWRTLSDVLYCTVDDLYKFRFISKLRALNILNKVRTYIENNKGSLSVKKDKTFFAVTEKSRVLNHILTKSILNKNGEIRSLSANDRQRINTYMNASLLIDDKLYLAALMRDTAIFDIMDVLGDFAGSVI